MAKERIKQVPIPKGIFRSEENGYYVIRNGRLENYINSKNTKTAVIPEGVKVIGGEIKEKDWKKGVLYTDDGFFQAFRSSGINNIYIPNSVKEIGMKSFEHCDIKYIHFPLSLNGVSEFRFCSIKEAYYDGTKKDFLENKNSVWCDNCNVIHCIDGDITELEGRSIDARKALINGTVFEGHNYFEKLIVHFREGYELDDYKRILGKEKYRKLKKDALKDIDIFEDDPIIEITIKHEQSVAWRDPNMPDMSTVRFNRIDGKMKIYCETDNRVIYDMETEIWEDLTERYFRELNNVFSDLNKASYGLDNPYCQVKIKRLSGKIEVISNKLLYNARRLNEIVDKINERMNELVDNLKLL